MTSYVPKLPLRDYQMEGLERMRGRSAFALLMAMRTGKTAVALADFGRLEAAGEIDDLLVVAPKGVYKTWLHEINKHASADLGLKLRDRVTVFDSGKKLKNGFLEDLAGPRILLCNIEALSREGRARETCEAFAKARRSMIIVDESTTIKNGKAIRTKYMIRKLAPLSKARRILSGLPTPRSPLDIYHQFEFLRPGLLGYPNYTTFRALHAITRKIDVGARWLVEIEVGYRNVEEIQRRVEPHAFRVEFRPNLPSTYSSWEVEMTAEQKKVYDELKLFATAALEEAGTHVTATMVITQMLRLHQVLCGHVVDESGAERVLPENKTSALLELLEEYAGKAVVWCSYDHDIRKVSAALAKEYDRDLYDANGVRTRRTSSVARFWGGNEKTREAEEQRFKSNPECRFMVATPDAGGRGRTWDVADLVVYYSSTNNLELRDQSEQRVQGTDKKVQVDYVDLICPRTVEDKILNALRRKMDMAALITGDAWREWIV